MKRPVGSRQSLHVFDRRPDDVAFTHGVFDTTQSEGTT